MRKCKLLFFIFAFGLFILTACDSPESVSNSINSSSEVTNSSNESTPTPTDTNDSSENESSNSNTESTSKDEEESQGKVKDDGTLDDGIEWGPLED